MCLMTPTYICVEIQTRAYLGNCSLGSEDKRLNPDVNKAKSAVGIALVSTLERD